MENKYARYLRIFLEYITLVASYIVVLFCCYRLFIDVNEKNIINIIFDLIFWIIFLRETIFRIKKLPFK